MKCKFCNSEVPEGEQKCPICGTEVETAGTPQPTGQDYYGNYGTTQPDAQAPADAPYNNPNGAGQFDPDNGNQYNAQNMNNQYNYGQGDAGQYGTGQPYNGQYGNAPGKEISSTPYMIFSIVVTLFCCLPLGIAAIVYASKINSLQRAGDQEGARAAAKKAKTFTIIGAIIGAVWLIISIIIAVVSGMNSLDSTLNSSTAQSQLEEAQDRIEDLQDDTDDADDDDKSTAAPAEASGELGDKWDSYTVQVNDKVLTLPCAIADLEAAGLTRDKEDVPDDYMVNANEYTLAYFEDANGNEIMVDLVNVGDKAVTATECLVGGVSVDDYSLEDGGLTVIFPGGVQIGTAKDDVLTKYGTTEDVYEGDSLDMYTWSSEDSYYKNCEIDFDPETGLAIGMSMDAYE